MQAHFNEFKVVMKALKWAQIEWLYKLRPTASFKRYLVVQDHDIMAVGTHPGVHSFAYAAYLIQRWSVMVWPAKVQNLKQTRGMAAHMWDCSSNKQIIF